MAQYQWSEIFLSLEGEAMFTGWPTVYIRFARCNFQCRGFNNPEGLDTTKVEVLGFDPKDYSDLKSLPLITRGCDSIYSWDKKFAHLWHKGDETNLAEETIKLLPFNSWIHPKSNLPVILSLTGGEPTLNWKTIPTLINHPLFADISHLLFETNCAVPLTWDFIDNLNDWLDAKNRKVIWSNSPKLSVSGEVWNKAIKPEIAIMQKHVERHIQYFKFVCDASERDFDEVEKAMKEYHNAGIPKNTKVYVMPVACTSFQQEENATQIANMCMERGYIFCIRLQNILWGNEVGT